MIVVPPVSPPEPEPLSASLSVALTDVEKGQVRRSARRAGMSMSAWARRRLV